MLIFETDEQKERRQREIASKDSIKHVQDSILKYEKAEKLRIKQEQDELQAMIDEEKTKIEILNWNWKAGGFGSVGIANITFKNNSKILIVKDIIVKINFKGESGAVLSSEKSLIPIILKPNEKKTAKEVNFGFINNQSQKASLEIVSFESEMINE